MQVAVIVIIVFVMVVAAMVVSSSDWSNLSGDLRVRVRMRRRAAR